MILLNEVPTEDESADQCAWNAQYGIEDDLPWNHQRLERLEEERIHGRIEKWEEAAHQEARNSGLG
jgi:hypothetical protein